MQIARLAITQLSLPTVGGIKAQLCWLSLTPSALQRPPTRLLLQILPFSGWDIRNNQLFATKPHSLASDAAKKWRTNVGSFRAILRCA